MNDEIRLEKKVIVKLLREIQAMARHASMTGSMGHKGARILVETYNRCRASLLEQGDATVGALFPGLEPEATSIDEVGAAAALLASYLEPEGRRASHGGHAGHCRHQDRFDEEGDHDEDDDQDKDDETDRG